MRVGWVWGLIKETFWEWMSDDLSRLAAGLAFYTLFSLSPILIIFMAMVGALYGNDAARTQVIAASRGFVGPRGVELVEMVLQDAHANSTALTVFGIFGLLFGATIVFVSLQDALNTIWSVAPKPGTYIWPFLRKRLVSFLVVLCLGVILLASLITSTAFQAFLEFVGRFVPAVSSYVNVFDFIASFGVLTLCFAIVYKMLPDARIAWRDVWVGSVAAAVLFTIGKVLIASYLAHSTAASTFGAASSLVFFLIWIYYSAQIVLLCGEFTQVYARLYGSGILPDDHAVRVLKSFEHPEEVRKAG